MQGGHLAELPGCAQAEPTLPAIAEILCLIVLVMAELWLLCCIWDGLKKGCLDLSLSSEVFPEDKLRRRDDPIRFWGAFVQIVFLAVAVAFLLFLYLCQRLQ